MSQLRGVFTVSLAVTIVMTVVSLGMGLRVGQLLAVLRRTRLLAVAALLNLLVVPAFAWLVASVLPLAPAHRVAVVLVAAGAGGATALHNDPRYQSAAILAALVNLAVASTIALLLRRAPRSDTAAATASSVPAEN